MGPLFLVSRTLLPSSHYRQTGLVQLTVLASLLVDGVAAAAHNQWYSTIWRTSLGIGVVFPLVLLVMRFRLKEPVEFSKHSFRHAKTPYRLVLKFYGWRLLIVSLIWFIYDASNPPFTAAPIRVLALILTLMPR